ncbi:Anaphase-promoting complex subunit 2 [Quaeritorhiza haematococci]|nr:Anaphase-promoting complex subunit 2 [Quaeritorhiza haematococci]
MVSQLYSSLTKDFWDVSILYFKKSYITYSQWCSAQRDEDDSFTVDDAQECQPLSAFFEVCRSLNDIGLTPMMEGVFIEILYNEIEEKIRSSCSKVFDEPLLDSCLQWLHRDLTPWLKAVMCIGHDADDTSLSTQLNQWVTRLDFHLFKTFYSLRVEELFDIIVEFPDSLPALNDLQTCMSKMDANHEVVNALKAAFSKRLLHQGASTSDILTSYVSSIKCLRILDRSGILVEKTTKQVRNYLRKREDTIRCIITTLIDDSHTELLEEMRDHAMSLSDEDELRAYETWVPIPKDPEIKAIDVSQRASDIFGTLINIYETKDVFVKEFQMLLADRLLALTDYNTEKEFRNVEVLRAKFGEQSMQLCEVMIKDIFDSKRVDNLIHTNTNDLPFHFHALVLSKLFWPNIRTESFSVHPEVEWAMEHYAEQFEAVKAARKLQFIPNAGTVQLSLELQDRTLELSVPPMHATVIMHFQEHESLSLTQLAELTTLSEQALQRIVLFWVNKGVLKDIGKKTYTVMEVAEKSSSANDVAMEVSTAIEDEHTAETENMRIYWSFVVGMLTNLGGLPLERIHSMLKMFVQGPNPFTGTPEQLRRFLDLMISENKLELNAGTYSLKT